MAEEQNVKGILVSYDFYNTLERLDKFFDEHVEDNKLKTDKDFVIIYTESKWIATKDDVVKELNWKLKDTQLSLSKALDKIHELSQALDEISEIKLNPKPWWKF